MFGTEIRFARCSRSALLCGTALVVIAGPAMAQLAPNAHPTGGTVVGGQAGISQTGNTTLIRQSSQAASINWQNFNVGSQASVNFQQPNSAAIALNRVVGPDPSEIAGHITANGQVVIVNQSGVVFDQGSQVDTAGLVVSASGITDRNFMAGHMVFDQAPHPGARVINNGTITIRQAGLAALVAPQVSNTGLIQAKLGRVILAGAAAYTLDLYGDGLLAINVTGQVTAVSIGGRTVPALVTNMGTILADGGTVLLTAQAADGLIRTLVSAGGTIAAQSVGAAHGRILAQGIGGSVEIDGAVSATGAAPGTSGGQIEANATGAVTVGAAAIIDASGNAGGGLIAIGTTAARAQGGPHVRPALTSASVSVARGSRIAADAKGAGDGGRITLLSDGLTSTAGAISVLGGLYGGNGGAAEVSGHTVALLGLVDARAARGRTGSLLIDPASLLIADTSPTPAKLGTNTFLSVATLTTELAAASVTMTAPGDIDFLYANGQPNHLVTGTNALSLSAAQGINIDNGFQITGTGAVTLIAQGGDVTFGTNLGVGFGLGANAGTITALQESAVTLQASGGILLSTATLAGTGSIVLSGGTGITGSGPLTTPVLSAVAGPDAPITLTGLVGTVTTLGTITSAPGTLATSGNIDIESTGALSAGNISTASGNVTLSAASLSLTGTIAAKPFATSLVSLNASTGDIAGAGAVVRAGTLTGSAPAGGAAIDLSGNNIVGTVTALSAGGNLRLTDTAALVVDGQVSGAEVALRSDMLSILNTGTITTPAAGIVALDLLTAGVLHVGGTLSLLSAASLGRISTGTLALGSEDGLTASGNATGLSVTGTLDVTGIANALGLFASTGTVSAAGKITANTVYGAGVGFSLTGTNAIGTLGTITAATLAVNDGQALTVSGTDTGTISAAIASTGLLTIASGGSVTGSATSLAGSDLAIAGNATGNATLTLTAATGTISAPGALSTALLGGSAAGTAALTGTNAITGLGGFTAAGFTLNDAADLTVTGSVNGAAAVSIADGGTLKLASTGTISGTATVLSGTDLTLSGSIAAPASLSLTASGTLTEAGSINTGTLSGSAVGTAALDGANTFTTLAGFTANGLSVKDSIGMDVTGNVAGTAAVGLIAGGTLTLDTGISITGSTTALTGKALALGGTITAPTSLALTATTGTISATGSITTGLLTGSAQGAADFAGTSAITDLGTFSAAGLTFAQAASLHVTGAVNGGAATSITSSGALSIDTGGSVAGSATSLTGTSLAIDGSVAGSAKLTLTAIAGTISAPGSLTSALLTGSATGSATLGGTNTITALGTFTASGFSLADTGPLHVTGSVNGTGAASITDTGLLTIDTTGSVTGAVTTLSGHALAIAGSVDAATSLDLISTTGTISAPGTLTAGLLTGSAATSADLEGANTITQLGTFAANGFTFVQSGAVDVTGAVTGGTLASISSLAGLSIEGSVAASATALSATSITLAGTASLTGSNTLTLTTTGTIGASGAITTNLLTGSAQGGASLTGTNTITGLGTFSAAGITLDDATSLTISGSVNGSTGVTIADTGTLTLAAAGSVAGSLTSLSGAGIVLDGTLSAANALALSAGLGGIGQTGTLTTGSLSGTSTGAVSFTGADTITALGNFTASGAFTLHDVQTLTVIGAVSAGSAGAPARLLLSAPTLKLLSSGTLTAAGGAIALQADQFSLAGSVTTGTLGVVALDTLANGATLRISGVDPTQITTGTLALGSLDGTTAAGQVSTILIDAPLDLTNHAADLALFTTATGTISQSKALTAGTLSGAAGTVTLTNAGNTITALGNLTAAGGLTYSQAGDLLVSGNVDGGPSAAITSGGLLTLAGSVGAISTSLSSTNLSITGTAGGTSSLTLATTGTITESGTLDTPLLTGSAGGTAALTGTTTNGTSSNLVTGLGSFTSAGFTLIGQPDLNVTGAVDGGTATSITSSGALSIAGTGSVAGSATSLTGTDLAIAGSATGSATLMLTATGGTISAPGSLASALLTGSATGSAALGGANTINALGDFTAAGFSLADTGPLHVSGRVNGTGSTSISTTGLLTIDSAGSVTGRVTTLSGGNLAIAGSVDAATSLDLISTTGTISAPGTLITGLLTGSAATSADLEGANTITQLGTFAANGFTFAQAGSVNVTGAVAGGTLASITSSAGLSIGGSVAASATALSATSITLAGTASLTGSNTLALTTTGTIGAAGAITTNLLTGSAQGSASLTGTNTITGLGTFSAAGITLDDATSLTISGSVNGSTGVTIADTGTLTLAAAGSVAGSLTSLSGAGIVLDGTLSAANALALSAGLGGIGQTGTLTTGSLSGTSTGAVSFTGADTVTTLGSFTATGFAFAESGGLTVTGPVDGGASASITSIAGLLDVTGSVTASATILSGASLTVESTASVTGSDTLALTAAGTIAAAGVLTSHLLTGSAGTSAALNAQNFVTGLGSFSAPSGFALIDAADLIVSGAVSGDTIAITARSVGNQGTLSAPTSLSLTATGNIASSGALTTTLLTGSAGGSASFSGAMDVTDLGDFTAQQGFNLAQAVDLQVVGTVSGGPTASILSLGLLSVGGTITAAATSLTGANLAVSGSATATAGLTLTATAGTISETGALQAGTLSGAATGGAATLTGSNSFATLASFSATGLTLADTGKLRVTGVVNGTANTSITDQGSLTLAAGGTISGAATTLSAAGLAIDGTLAPSDSLSLLSQGAITEGGSISTTSLTGSATGAVSLTGTNHIAAIGSFQAQGLTLTNLGDLAVGTADGSPDGGPSLVLSTTGLLTVTGSPTAQNTSLTGSAISINGTATGSNTLTLIATSGTINETGALATALLTGSATGSATLAGTVSAGGTSSNTITGLGSFTSAGFTLDTAPDLLISGAVDGQATTDIVAGGTLTIAVGASVRGAVTSLTGAALAIDGSILAADALTLIALTGGITEPGSITTALLTGLAAGTASLTGSNTIGTLGMFSANPLIFNDAGNLTIAGTLTGGAQITLATTGTLTVAPAGVVDASAITLSGSNLTLDGTVIGPASVALAASTGTIAEAGTLTTALLTGSAFGAASLSGTGTGAANSNSIGTLGSFTAASLLLNDGPALSVAGPVALATSAVITTGGNLTIPGTITAPTVLTLISTAGSIGQTGGIATTLLTGSAAASASFGGTDDVTDLGPFTAQGFAFAEAGTLHVTGAVQAGASASVSSGALLSVDAGGSVAAASTSLSGAALAIAGSATGTAALSLIATSGTILETGQLTAGLLTGSATGAATLSGTNSITALGTFTAAGFSLSDASGLTVTGAVNGGTAAFITDALALSIADTASILGSTTKLSATSIGIAGAITASTALSLTANAGAITETGTIDTGVLTGSATGSASFSGNDAVSHLGSFTAAGFAFTQFGGLIVDGLVNGGTLATISAGDLTIPGSITAGTLSLAATAIAGTITETGALNASLLSGSAIGSAALGGSNAVGTLGDFNAAGFSFNDNGNLLAAGPVNGAATVSINDAGTLTVGGSIAGTTISLSAAALALNGTILAPSVLSLTSGSFIDAPGSITTSLLTGSAAGSASFSGANAITLLGDFNAAGLLLRDGRDLSVTGTVNGNPSAQLDIAGTLTVQGAVTASATSLSATNITIPGAVTGSNTLTLTANPGTISENGSLTSQILTGSAGGTASLIGSNSINTILAFNAAGFTLRDTPDLAITGAVNGGTLAAITDAGTLSILASGSVTGSTVVLTAAAMAEAGSIQAGLLTGTATATATLSGTNTIADLGDFTASGLTLDNAAPLAVTGTVTGGSSVVIASTGPLTVGGSITAAAVDLTAPSLALPGSIDGSQTLTLTALAGGIAESGHLLTRLLSGSASASAALTGGNNITSLGNFTAAGLTLNDTPDLAVAGAVNGGTLAAITDTGTLNVGGAGSITAATIALTAASLADAGALTAASTLNLIATSGTIAETGAITAGTLTGASPGDTTLTGTNRIGTLANFNAPNIALTDLQALDVSGSVTAGTLAAITDANSVSLSGSITAPTIDLAASSIDIPGAAAASTLSLTATAGAITENGRLTAVLLTGGSTGATTLTGSNAIDTLGIFTASGFTLADTSALTIAGPLQGGPAVAITGASTLDVAGSLSGSTATLQAAAISIPGTISAATALTLTATAGTISETGQIATSLLTGTSAGSTRLAGPGNAIGTLSNFAAQGFTLVTAQALDVAGAVNGGPALSITTAGKLSVPGSLLGDTVALAAAAIDETGAIGAPGTLSMVANAGTIATTGSILAGTLTGSTTGSASFAGTDQIARLANFTAAGFTLLNTPDLVIAGRLAGGPSVFIADQGALFLTGAIAAQNVTLNAASIAASGAVQAGLLSGSAAGSATLLNAGNSIAALGNFSAANLALNDGTALSISGTVHTGTAALTAAAIAIPGVITGTTSLAFVANAGAIDGTGQVITPLLNLQARSGSISLTGANQIATLDGAVSRAGFNLIDDVALSITGTLTATAGNIDVTAPDVSLPGTATSPGRITFGAPGTITLAGGTLDAPTILLGGNTTPPALVAWDGGTILTGSTIPAAQSKPAFPRTDGSATGIFVQADDFRQAGSTLVNPHGGSATVFITLDRKGGTIAFSPNQGAGLIGPSTQLFLNLNAGGVASGQVVVAGLSITYTPPAAPKLSDLGGTIGGLGGQSASGRAYIIPVPDANYRFNACAIGSVNCVLLSPVIVPIFNPTGDVTIDTPHRKRQDDDLIIPNVGEEDF